MLVQRLWRLICISRCSGPTHGERRDRCAKNLGKVESCQRPLRHSAESEDNLVPDTIVRLVFFIQFQKRGFFWIVFPAVFFSEFGGGKWLGNRRQQFV